MKITILLVFFCNVICFSQENIFTQYYEQINKAEIANVKNEFNKADSIYNGIFMLYKNGFAIDYFKAAKNAKECMNTERVIDYLKRGFKNGLLFEIVKNDSIYLYLKQNADLHKLKYSYKTIRKEYLDCLSTEVRSKVAKLVKEDQKYRKWRYEKRPWKEQQALLNKVDDKNFDALLSICKEKGFPGRSLVGDDGDEIGWVDVPVLLRHMDSIKLMKLKPFIMQAISTGEFHPFHYGFALDHTSMFKTTINDLDENGDHILIIQQKYGIVIRFEKGKKFIFPVEDLININEYRRNIGLESIEDYAFKNDVAVPEEGFYKRILKTPRKK